MVDWKVVSQLQYQLYLPLQVVSFCSHFPLEYTHFFGSFFSSKISFLVFAILPSILIVSKFASRKSMDSFLSINMCLPAWSLASNTLLVTSFLCLILLSLLSDSTHLLPLYPHVLKFQGFGEMWVLPHVFTPTRFSVQNLYANLHCFKISGMLMAFLMTSALCCFIFWSLNSSSITRSWSL